MNNTITKIMMEAGAKAIKEMMDNGLSEDEIREKLSKNTLPAIESLVDAVSNDIIKYINDNMSEIVLEKQAQDAEFLTKHESKWHQGFTASQMMYILAIEVADEYLKHIEEKVDAETLKNCEYTFLTLKHLYGRACQVFLEILTLMKGGFADGAFARWRLMHELSYVAYFIKMQGEDIAKRYYEQSMRNNEDYKWANVVEDKNGKKVKGFAQIQKICDEDPIWNKQYKLSCSVTHASPEGTFGRMSNPYTINAVPVGRSDYGISVPAEHSAISLNLITTTFLTLFTNIDSCCYISVMNKWVNIIRKAYDIGED